MQVSIVGLPRSGKTTVFNAATRGHADVAAYADSKAPPNLGVAKVPDRRLDRLADIYGPKRIVPAEVAYVDLPGPPDGAGEGSVISGEHLNHLQAVDAVLVVVRAFDDPSVTHVDGSVDPFRDIDTMLTELSIADMEILERRLARLAASLKGAKAAEREVVAREQALLERLKTGLEVDGAIRKTDLAADESKLLAGFQLLTARPLIIVANIGEEQIGDTASLEARLSSEAKTRGVRTAILCGKLEMELAQMEPEEELEFRESLGVGESGSDRMIGLSHETADLIAFFTGNQNEVRAWTVARGTIAVKAAGKVHSDFERGFIRAEVIGFDDLMESGTTAEARNRGRLRQEGKEYVVQDGDVLNILFSV